jgi:hypothetical protein
MTMEWKKDKRKTIIFQYRFPRLDARRLWSVICLVPGKKGQTTPSWKKGDRNCWSLQDLLWRSMCICACRQTSLPECHPDSKPAPDVVSPVAPGFSLVDSTRPNHFAGCISILAATPALGMHRLRLLCPAGEPARLVPSECRPLGFLDCWLINNWDSSMISPSGSWMEHTQTCF